MNIYVAGPIAYESARRFYEEHREELAARFPRFFLRDFEKLSEEAARADAFLGNFCIENSTKRLYSKKNCCLEQCRYLCRIAEGGVFAALWEACEALKTGCRVSLEEIPVDQHVIEILELWKESPYEVSSKGSFLLVKEEPEEAAAEQKKEQTPGHEKEGQKNGALKEWPEELRIKRIGQTTAGNERILLSGDGQRFLTPPQRQAKDIENRSSAWESADANCRYPAK